MRSSDCSRAAVALLLALLAAPGLGARQQPPLDPRPTSFAAEFLIYVRSVQVGRELVSVARTPDGWTVSSSGRMAPPIDLVTNDLQIKYTPDWKPIELNLDATVRGQNTKGRTTIADGTARSVFTQAGQSGERSAAVAADVLLLPDLVWSPFEALAQRLQTAADGATIPVFTLQAAAQLSVTRSQPETFKTATRTIAARRSFIKVDTSSGTPLEAEIWADDQGHLLRVSIPAQGLEVVRGDIASVAVRYVPVSRPGDQEVRMPSLGFTLAGTLSRPATGAGPLPTVILVGGSGLTDRDETIAGIPIFGQLAGALADAGFLVLRYDRRGIGQSGGRPESAGMDDYASDLLATVKFLRARKDVDKHRLALVGHADGGSIAMLAAAKEKDVRAIALLSASAVSGSELTLWQATHRLDRQNLPAEQRQATIELQKKIQTAVLTGQGWDTIPVQFKREADTAWFRSYLTFKPEVTMRKVHQPVFVLQGLLDKQVPPDNAVKFEQMPLKGRKTPIQVVRVPGVNHILVPASTGEVDEYASLKETSVSPGVVDPLVRWLRQTFTTAN